MTTYQEITQQIGDQWVAALKRAEDTVDAVASGIEESRSRVDLPTNDSLAKLSDSLTQGLPKASEVVQANFELTSRLLAAQRDLTLRILDASNSADPTVDAPTAKNKKG